MAKSHTKTLNIVAMVLLTAMVIGFVSLGRWQLSRADERRSIAAAIEQGRNSSPLDLAAVKDERDLTPWRPASAEGVWLNQYSVLLDNRNLDGRPGLWLATPLQMEDGRAVLVLRGWLPRPIALQPGRPTDESVRLQSQPGKQKVSGEISIRVPRLYELWSPVARAEKGLPEGWPAGKDANESATVDTMLRVQNLDVTELSNRSGLRFIPVVLMQGDTMEDGMTRVWPGPSIDYDKNVGYAVQWFGFAAIAGLVLLGLIYKVLRRQRPAR